MVGTSCHEALHTEKDDLVFLRKIWGLRECEQERERLNKEDEEEKITVGKGYGCKWSKAIFFPTKIVDLVQLLVLCSWFKVGWV